VTNFNKLPLSPTDLVVIYKEKQENSAYVLMIDYEGTKEVLSVEHILIYLANTGFVSGFSSVDSELLLKYIEMDFLVDSPTIARVWANILKTWVNAPLSESDQALLSLFSEADIAKFIEENQALLQRMADSLCSVAVAVITNIMETTPNETESHLGTNMGFLLRDSIDAVLNVIVEKGLSDTVDVSVFNDQSKYFGGDIYKWMHDNGVLRLICSMLPKDHEVFSSSVFEQQ